MVYDINLIPKTRINASQKARFVVISVVLLFAVLLGILGLYLPTRTKLKLIDQIKKQEKELMAYSTVNEEFTTLTATMDDLKRMEGILKQLKDNNLIMTELLADLETCIPNDITIKTLAFDEGMLTLDGSSPDYEKIAQYIVNIRKLNRVINVTFLSAATDQELTEEGTMDDSKILFNFTLYVKLDAIDILPMLAVLEAEGENIAFQEVVD